MAGFTSPFGVLPLGPAALNPPRRLSARDWEDQRTIFEQLYVAEEKPLREVVEIMGRDHNFFATESQYKKKISKWHLDKKVKGEEMERIVRKQAKRRLEGKDSDFTVRGQAVEPEKIDRYKRRKNVSDTSILSQPSPIAATPSDICCYTPDGGGPPTPDTVPKIRSHLPISAFSPTAQAHHEPFTSSSTTLAQYPRASTSPLPHDYETSNSLGDTVARQNSNPAPHPPVISSPSETISVSQTFAAIPTSQGVRKDRTQHLADLSDTGSLDQTSLSAFGYAKSSEHLNSTLGIYKKIENHGTDSPSSLFKPTTSVSDLGGLREKYKSFVRQLPAKTYVENLIATFFHDVNYEYYPVDEAIFRDHLKDWNDLSFYTLNKGPQELPADLQFLPALLFQMLALALQYQPPDYDPSLESLKYAADMSLDDLASDFSESGVAISLLLGKRNTSLVTVQAGFLRTAFLRNSGMVAESWHSLSQTIRDAQEIGIHKDYSGRPRHRPEATPGAVLESLWLEQLQRRLWLILLIWDVQMAVTLGRPTTIDVDTDGRPVFPIDAPITQNRREVAPSPRGELDPPTPVTMLLWMIELSAPLWDILKLEKEDPKRIEISTAEKMHKLINQISLHTPPFFRAYNPDLTFDSYPACYWLPHARSNLQNTLAFTTMALHRPYIFTTFSSRTCALKAALEILRAQHAFFALLTAKHYKIMSLVLSTFDATVLVAAIFILYPSENTEDRDDALQHFEWAMERFSLMSGRNSTAKAALGVMTATYVRLKKALDQSKTARSLPFTTPAGSASAARSPRLQVAPSSASPNHRPVDNEHQSVSIDSGTTIQDIPDIPSAISNHLEPTPALSSEWEAFSGGMPIAPEFDFSSMAPLQPMHDLLFNDLFTGEWQFEGDFGNDSFWGYMNTM